MKANFVKGVSRFWIISTIKIVKLKTVVAPESGDYKMVVSTVTHRSPKPKFLVRIQTVLPNIVCEEFIMYPLFSKFGRVQVVFTHHARQRILQRYKLFMTKYERDDPNIFLKKDFKLARLNMPKHLTPFYVNRRDSKYGKNAFMAKSPTMCYFGNYNEQQDKIIVRSVIPINSM